MMADSERAVVSCRRSAAPTARRSGCSGCRRPSPTSSSRGSRSAEAPTPSPPPAAAAPSPPRRCRCRPPATPSRPHRLALTLPRAFSLSADARRDDRRRRIEKALVMGEAPGRRVPRRRPTVAELPPAALRAAAAAARRSVGGRRLIAGHGDLLGPAWAPALSALSPLSPSFSTSSGRAAPRRPRVHPPLPLRARRRRRRHLALSRAAVADVLAKGPPPARWAGRRPPRRRGPGARNGVGVRV